MISEARANATLGYEFGLRSFVPSNTYWLGLSTTPITNGAGYSEPDASTGYVRVAIPNTASSWSIPSNRIVSNLIQLSFDPFTGSSASGDEVTHWFIAESETGGNAIYYGELAHSRPIIVSSQIWVDVGELKIERTNLS